MGRAGCARRSRRLDLSRPLHLHRHPAAGRDSPIDVRPRERCGVDNMARSGHMKAMRQTNVSGLKARLSEYLAAVRNGETVVVHDRRTPIARLVPVGDNAEDLSVVEPTRPLERATKVKPPRLRRRSDVVRLLRESRDQRIRAFTNPGGPASSASDSGCARRDSGPGRGSPTSRRREGPRRAPRRE